MKYLRVIVVYIAISCLAGLGEWNDLHSLPKCFLLGFIFVTLIVIVLGLVVWAIWPFLKDDEPEGGDHE